MVVGHMMEAQCEYFMYFPAVPIQDLSDPARYRSLPRRSHLYLGETVRFLLVLRCREREPPGAAAAAGGAAAAAAGGGAAAAASSGGTTTTKPSPGSGTDPNRGMMSDYIGQAIHAPSSPTAISSDPAMSHPYPAELAAIVKRADLATTKLHVNC